MNEQSRQLFKTLTEMSAAPGFEKELRQFVRQELEGVSDECVQDRMGSIFGVVNGNQQGPRVMVAGHMDEVGFIVTSITDNGMIKFMPLGGWWNQVLLAQRFKIETDEKTVIGVVASTPPHLLTEQQRSQPPAIEQLFLDIGADDREDAEQMGIRPGLQMVPDCPFTPMQNPKKWLAKAWDNRYGVGLAIELLKDLRSKGERPPNKLYAGATVQEEVGLRGAETAANMIQPDIFYALDASPANDPGGDKNAFGQLGNGALLRIYDRSMITHRGLIDFVRDTAETHDIPYQYFVSPGGTDAGKVQLHGIGVPSAVIGVCARYIHTSASIIHTDDIDAAKELLYRLVMNTDQSTIDTLIRD